MRRAALRSGYTVVSFALLSQVDLAHGTSLWAVMPVGRIRLGSVRGGPLYLFSPFCLASVGFGYRCSCPVSSLSTCLVFPTAFFCLCWRFCSLDPRSCRCWRASWASGWASSGGRRMSSRCRWKRNCACLSRKTARSRSLRWRLPLRSLRRWKSRRTRICRRLRGGRDGECELQPSCGRCGDRD